MKYNQLVYIAYYILLAGVFLFGGSIQFFLGLSNSLMTLFFAGVGILTYTIYVITKKAVVYNTIILFALICFIYVILNGFINNIDWLKTMLYLIFVLVPLSSYLLSRTFYSTNKSLSNSPRFFLIFVAKTQLPILLLQRYYYDNIIKYNQSTQIIDSIDFPFGTFFIKNDHALGFLLICTIVFLLFNEKNRGLTKLPFLYSLYLSATIFFINSKVTFVLLVVVWVVFWYKKTPRYSLVILVFLASIILAYSILEGEYLERGIEIAENFGSNHEYKRSFRFYNEGVAKRSHTLVVLFNNDLSLFGHGPYSYFNILTGKFNTGVNHSQWIWLLYDIGVFGVIIFGTFIFSFFLNYKPLKSKGVFLMMLSFILYCYFTNVLSDLSFMLTTFIYLKSYEG